VRAKNRHFAAPLRTDFSVDGNRSRKWQHAIAVTGIAKDVTLIHLARDDRRRSKQRGGVLQIRTGTRHLIQDHNANSASILACKFRHGGKLQPARCTSR